MVQDPPHSTLLGLLGNPLWQGLYLPSRLERKRHQTEDGSDIVNGRLNLAGRSVPLAAPFRERLTRWPDYRQSRWPNSQNPHLIIHQRSAPRMMAANRTYPRQQGGICPQALREDRILAEAHATRGDARAISDLFGLSLAGTDRCIEMIEHPDLAIGEDA